MQHTRAPRNLAGPGIMLISAAIFGYFGFTSQFVHTSSLTGQFLIYVPMLEWTLKASAISFLLSALVTFKAPFSGNLLFAVTGILAAVMFLIVAILDILDTKHMVMHPALLLIFAAWNGYASWTALRDLLTMRRSSTELIDMPDDPM